MTENEKRTNGDSVRIGEIIKTHRIKKGLTQAQLGDMLFVSKQAVSKWENGRTMPDIETLRKLSEILEISNDEIFPNGTKTAQPEMTAPVPPLSERKKAPLPPESVPGFSPRAKRIAALSLMIFITAFAIVFAFLLFIYPIPTWSGGISYIPEEISTVNYGNYTLLDRSRSSNVAIDYVGDRFAWLKRGLLSDRLALIDSSGRCEYIDGIGAPFQLYGDKIVHYRGGGSIGGKLLCRDTVTGEDAVIEDSACDQFVVIGDLVVYYKTDDSIDEFGTLDTNYILKVCNLPTLHSRVISYECSDFAVSGDKLWVLQYDDRLLEISLTDFAQKTLVEVFDYIYLEAACDDYLLVHNGLPWEMAIFDPETLETEKIPLIEDAHAIDDEAYICSGKKMYYSFQRRDDAGGLGTVSILFQYDVEDEANGLYEIDLETKEMKKLAPDTYDKLYLFDGDKLFGIKNNELYIIDADSGEAKKL